MCMNGRKEYPGAESSELDNVADPFTPRIRFNW